MSEIVFVDAEDSEDDANSGDAYGEDAEGYGCEDSVTFACYSLEEGRDVA